MQINKTEIDDLLIINPDIFSDDRGFFMESFRSDYLESIGIKENFPQDNHSQSIKNVIRGLHFQWNQPLGKLIRVTKGKIFVVALDIRKKSKTFGKYCSLYLSEESKKQLWAPFGFATGFCACSKIVDVQYKCTAIYNPKAESGINPFDKDLNINWPIQREEAIMSQKDSNAQTLLEWSRTKESDVF